MSAEADVRKIAKEADARKIAGVRKIAQEAGIFAFEKCPSNLLLSYFLPHLARIYYAYRG